MSHWLIVIRRLARHGVHFQRIERARRGRGAQTGRIRHALRGPQQLPRFSQRQRRIGKLARWRPARRKYRSHLEESLARDKWAAPAPRLVLLVGKASYDYGDKLKGKNKNLVPTLQNSSSLTGSVNSGYTAKAVSLTLDSSSSPPASFTHTPARRAR
jgi:hypothetical protein